MRNALERAIKDYYTKNSEDRLSLYSQSPTSSVTLGAVTLIGYDLYVRFGATDWEIQYGYEQFISGGYDQRVKLNALNRLISFLADNIKEKYT